LNVSDRSGFVLHVAPAIVYTVLVFVGGSLEAAPAPPDVGIVPGDKLMHFVAFAGLALLILRAVRWELPLSRFSSQLVLATLMASALGGLLELWQAALPHRDADVFDWVSDTLGALCVAGALFVARSRRPVE